MRRLGPQFSVALCAFVAACAVDPGPGPGTGDSGGFERDGKISTNGLVLDESALADLRPATLGAGWLSDSDVAAAPHTDALAETPAGMDLLRYVATCALPAGESLVVEAPGGDAVHEMPGLVGLAPEWIDAPCDDSCQRWVSACLLAHANGRSEPFEISLRAEHPAIAWTEEIAATFEVEEAAYYGNLFAPEPEMYACIGRGLFDGTWAAQTSHIEGRVCGLAGSCGLEQTGPCHSITGDLVDTATCERGGDGAYGACHTEAQNPDSPAFTEVVTVYLAR